jgi:uncharacterized protein with FMN-binding domain
MKHRRSLMLFLPALTTAVGACGGSSGSATTAATAPTTGAAPLGTTTATASGAGQTAAGGRNFAGSVVTNRFGDNQVTLIVKGSRITDVRYTLPRDRPRSAAINEQAGPLLRQEVLQAQSAKIDVVSGATYTSEAFVQSLQQAASQAHLPVS